VLELGMNHPGEMALLAAMAAPSVVVVNNAQREHQEFMHSVEAVARENGSALAALGADGVAVLPADDPYLPLWRQLAGSRRVYTFGLQAGAEVWLQVQQTPGALQPWQLLLHAPAHGMAVPQLLTLQLPGLHNVHNAAAAAAAALAAGAPPLAVVQGLSAFQPVAGRSQVLQLQQQGRSVTLIDDSYNANPDSVLAAIDLLASLPAPRWLVLGDMGEVGSQGPQFHAEAGAHARARGIDNVWAAGALCAHLNATRHFEHTAALVAALHQAPAAASVLVKGSRFMKMEQVVQALRERLQSSSPRAGGQGAPCC
jgi:UDP-N-acetylmuramoyl-tripeptide--D-alanyl-D-alanine ligase